MPIRIYTLAKELKLDSKSLVEICDQAGVAGKGSALASLSEEEVEKVKEYLNRSRGGRAAAPAASTTTTEPRRAVRGGAIRREDYIAPGGVATEGKVRVLTDRARRRQVEASQPAVEEPPSEAPPPEAEVPQEPGVEAVRPEPEETAAPPEEAVEAAPAAEPEQPSAADEAAKAPGAAEEAPVEPAPETTPEPPPQPSAPPARPVYGPVPFEPRRAESKPTEKDRADKDQAKDQAKEKKGRPKDRERPAPTIKLAPVPTSRKPAAPSKPAEPAPQKPDIKLPIDAIRASKAGAKPLAEHLRKQEESRKTAKKGKPAERAPKEAAADGLVRSGRARGRGTRESGPTEDPAAALAGREQRQLKRKRSTRRRRGEDEETSASAPRRLTRLRRSSSTAAPRKSNVVIELPCTVRSFSEAIGVSASRVLAKLLSLGAGVGVNINAQINAEMADLLAVELGVEVDFRSPQSAESRLLSQWEESEEDPALVRARPPVITFLGHVDHGKTSLLDRILGLDVVSGEKGGITQHIRAYQIHKDGRPISFVDTPGHEAFTEMRARGANCTDIAVLVVAAEDGVMPQTEEAISHARAAGVPIVVALNKIDLPGANPQRVFEQLAANDLLPTEWGGDLEVVKTSAMTGEGVDELLETLLTVAELQEYQANPERPAMGTCLEAALHEGHGVVAKLLVQTGTLRVGDAIVCGTTFGRVKALFDTLHEHRRLDEAGPSVPVNLTGLHETPAAGDRFHVVENVTLAREVAAERVAQSRQASLGLAARPHVTLENLFERLGEKQEVQTLNIILRADVRGSIEAINKELQKLEHPEVQIRVLQATVGGITEADVHLADASDAVIIGFNVVPDEGARTLAEQRGVQIRRYEIIYQVTEDLKAALEGMLKPEKREEDLGRALVKQTFQISRVGTIAGCQVLNGHILRDARVRVIRENRIIGDYPLDSLRREKEDAREVRAGLECGMKLKGFNDLKEGDILEAYRIEEVRRTF